MAELRLSLDVRISPRLARLGLTAALLVLYAPELVSESVSLTTYYPAPSGIYTQMITTSNTWLARDSSTNSSYLMVGSNAAAGNVGAGTGNTRMAVMNGRLGVGTVSPQGLVDVAGGAITGNYGLTPRYANWAAYGTGDGGAAIYNSNEGAYQALMLVGNSSGGGVRRVKVWDELTVNGNSIITGSEQVNGNINANGNITAGGKVQAGTNGHGVFPVTTNYCYTITVTRNGGSQCAGGYYITLISGVFSRYYAVGSPLQMWNTGTGGAVPGESIGALCCPCPAGGCPP